MWCFTSIFFSFYCDEVESFFLNFLSVSKHFCTLSMFLLNLYSISQGFYVSLLLEKSCHSIRVAWNDDPFCRISFNIYYTEKGLRIRVGTINYKASLSFIEFKVKTIIPNAHILHVCLYHRTRVIGGGVNITRLSLHCGHTNIM